MDKQMFFCWFQGQTYLNLNVNFLAKFIAMENMNIWFKFLSNQDESLSYEEKLFSMISPKFFRQFPCSMEITFERWNSLSKAWSWKSPEHFLSSIQSS